VKIVFIPGDGVGNEIADELHKICKALENYTNLIFNIQRLDLGYKHYFETGLFVPEIAIKECKQAAAVWVGPLAENTHDGQRLKKNIIRQLSNGLGIQFFYRKITSFNPNITLLNNNPVNLTIMQDCQNYGLDSHLITKSAGVNERFIFKLDVTQQSRIELLIKYAVDLVHDGSHKRITLVLPEEQTFQSNPWVENIKNQIDVKIGIISAERFVFKLLHNPTDLDLILTISPYGELFSGIGSALEGGLGLSYESFINPKGPFLYSIMHPHSERYAGKDAANPIGAIRSLSEILFRLNRPGLSKALNRAVSLSLEAGWSTRDMGGSMGTNEIGDFICNKISELIPEKK